VPDRLFVSPDGLLAASATLNEHASQLVPADGAARTGGKASSAGAASVSAAITAFSAAYGGRLTNRGQSAEVAAASYTAVDDDGATEIGAVSV
jgi:hypothetical protein